MQSFKTDQTKHCLWPLLQPTFNKPGRICLMLIFILNYQE